MLAAAPDFEDALVMKAELEGQIADVDARISALMQQTASPVDSQPDKWDKEAHPAFRNQSVNPSPAEEKKAPHTFKVNDTVTAKYAGDKQFYEARIISITGSSHNPIYTVNFKGYSGTETVRAQDMRPFAAPAAAAAPNSLKRKADDSTASAINPASSVSAAPASGVISAAPNIDAEKASALRDQAAAKTLDGKDKPKVTKKARTSKALETSKNNWQAWQGKASKGKAAKVATKDSMFRTGEAPTARGNLLPATPA
jgi:survival-of-motor-neuron-related-splicing factor 30